MPPDRCGTTPLGDLLRGERIRRGLKIEEITAATGIAGHYIRALESEQFEAIPAGVYRRSFVRQYARLLGMNEHEIVTAYQERYPEPPVPLPQIPPRKRPVPPAGVLWLMASFAAVLTLYYFLQPEIDARKHVLPQTAALQRRANAPDRVQPAPNPAPASTGSADRAAELQVKLTATEPVWVRVKCDGLEAYTGTLSESQIQQFDATREITALVGNAGGLTYWINGKSEGPTGGHGEIQSLQFTAAGLRVLSRHAAR